MVGTIAGLIIELVERGLLVWYSVDGKMYVEFPGFSDSQRGLRKDREASSRIPTPQHPGAQLLTAMPDECRSNAGVTPAQGKGREGKGSSTVSKETGLKPNVEKYRGEFATIIRKYWWQSKEPPIRPHSMINDMDIRTQLLKQGWDAAELNKVLALYVGQPATLKLVYKRGGRGILNELRGKYHKLESTKMPSISQIMREA